MEDIRRKYNPIMDLSKFTFNKKILSKVVTNFVAKLCLYMFSNNFDYIKRLGQNLVSKLVVVLSYKLTQ